MRFSLFVCSSLLIHKQQLWLGEKYKMKQRATVEIVKTKFQCAFLRWSFFVAGFFFLSLPMLCMCSTARLAYMTFCNLFRSSRFEYIMKNFCPVSPFCLRSFCTFEQMVSASDASSLSVFLNVSISISVLPQKNTHREKAQFHRKAYELPYIFSKTIWPDCLFFCIFYSID